MADSPRYSKPALTFVLYGFGVLFAGTAAWIAFQVQPRVLELYEGDAFAGEVVKAAAFLALFPGVLCLAAGLALDFMGQIAYNTRQMPVVERFYYQGRDGQTAGPATVDELKRLAASGAINAATLVCQEGREDWQALAARVPR